MALTHKHRSALYEGLSGIVDEEAVDEMLAYFPTRGGDEPINRDFLRAEMSDLRTELRTEMSDMETRLVDRIDTKFNQVIAANLVTLVAFAAVIIAAVRL